MAGNELVTGGLVEDKEFSKELSRELRQRAKDYIEEGLKKPLLASYEADGWESVKENKDTYRVRKQKAHDVQFEDRVWSLLCRLGFKKMNKNRDFRIKYLKDLSQKGKQIDVFALDDEVVICVECKSSEKFTRTKSFATEINEIGGIREKLITNIKKHFGSSLKVGFLFATQNIVFTEPDKKKLEEYKILAFSQEELSYYEGLVKHLGSVAKFQFLARAMRGQEIEGLRYAVPAIRGELGGGTYYSFSIEPYVLLKLGFILHRTEMSSDSLDTYQRMVNKSRVKEIGEYIDEGGFFPNNLIVNFATKRALKFEPMKDGNGDGISSLGMLHLPSRYHSAFIIDGQHRLFGYGKSKWAEKNTVPVVAFENLDSKIQTKIFVDINNKQKSVPKNLLLTLMAEFNWGSNDPGAALQALKIRLIRKLSSDDSSALYKRIVTAEEKQDDTRCLTQNYILSQAINKVNFFADVKAGKIVKLGYLWGGDYPETLEKSYKFLQLAFDHIEKELLHQWRLGRSEGGFVAMNAGVCSLIRLLDDIVTHLVTADGLEPEKSTPEKMIAMCKKYLDVALEFLNNLDPAGIKTLRSFVGGSAVDRVLMEYRNSINERYEEFNPFPAALEAWRKENSGVYNDESKKICDDLQLALRGYIQFTLCKEYGEKRWWKEGIPTKIQKECAMRLIDEGTDEDPWNFLDIRHYDEIIRKEKNVLLEKTTRDDLKSKGIDKKLYWVAPLIKIRNKVAHPERVNVTEEELEVLKEISGWLLPNITKV